MRTAAVIVAALGAAMSLCSSQDPAPARRLDAGRMNDTVRALYALGPAAEGLPSKDAVREAILTRLRASGATVKVLPFAEKGPAGEDWQLENLLASFNPAARNRVMLACHWDTRLWAEKDPDPSRRNSPIPGANDGFSGMAVLVEIADHLGKEPLPAGFGVDLVFFDGEEGPEGRIDRYFLGSRNLAGSWFETGVALPRGAVLIDMVGRKGLRIRREEISQREAKPLLDELFAIAAKRRSPVFEDAPGPPVLDDHLPFLERGIPMVDLIDFGDPHWHTHQDTIDKLDPKAMVEVGEVLIDWVRERARGAP